jgi:hypothetical protein
MTAVFTAAIEGEELRVSSAFPFPFSEALLSCLHLERLSSAPVGSAGPAAVRGSGPAA